MKIPHGTADENTALPEAIETPYARNIRIAEERGFEKGFKKGFKKGLKKARRERFVRLRNILRRQTNYLFGAKAADRLAVLINRIDDPERLEEIGELIISSKKGSQLLKQVEKLSA